LAQEEQRLGGCEGPIGSLLEKASEALDAPGSTHNGCRLISAHGATIDAAAEP